MPQHGTTGGYKAGCRCALCLKAESSRMYVRRRAESLNGDLVSGFSARPLRLGGGTIPAETLLEALRRQSPAIKREIVRISLEETSTWRRGKSA